MSQRDLFDPPPEKPRCGNCVTYNRVVGQDFGHCSRKGIRRRAEKPCEEWFGLDELNKPAYGGGNRSKGKRVRA